jgi:5-methylcytosine-specific restriction endonuclease McrA
MEISQEVPVIKICANCGCEKNTFRKRKDGYTRKICRKCEDDRAVKRKISTKTKCVEYKGGKCFVCGYNKYQGSLDFHHIDPKEKDFTIGNMRGTSFEKLKNELDKCVLLCKNCHYEVHAGLIDLNKICGSSTISYTTLK